MSTTFEASLPIRAAEQSTTHPLAPIDATEIKQAVSYVRSQWPANTDLHFKCITLQEPAKKEVVPYLEAEVLGATLPQIDRRVLITYYIRRTVSRYTSPRSISALTYWLEQIPRSCCQPIYRNAGVQCSSWPELACSWRWRRDNCHRASGFRRRGCEGCHRKAAIARRIADCY
jgi:hypothetical protein